MGLRDSLSSYIIFSQAFWLPRYYALFKLASLESSQTVLDAGCGLGIVSLRLAKRGLKVWAVDKDFERVKQARSFAKKFGLGDKIKFIVADLSSLPFASSAFDKIVSLDVLEYIDDDTAVFKEFNRLLKKDGRVLLTLPLDYIPSAVFSLQRILRKLTPKLLFSRDLPNAQAWLEVDGNYLRKKLGDARKVQLEDLKAKIKPYFESLNCSYYYKLFSSLATDITYGIKGLSRFKLLFFYLGVRIDHYLAKKSPGYGIFLELAKR